MARKSKMVSPEKAGAANDHEDDNNGPFDFHGDGALSHLVANMGNTSSKEELNKALHATVQQIQKTRDHIAQSPSTGKLKRPSTGTRNNPAYRNPLTSVASVQRRLGPANNIRKSIDDQIQDSPVKLVPPKAQWTEGRIEISPRRNEKRKAKRGNESAVEAAAAVASDQDETPERNTKVPGLAQHNIEVAVEVEEEELNRAFVDLFPDHVVQQRLQEEREEQEAEAGANDEQADGIELRASSDRDGHVATADAPAQYRASRGHPKKSFATVEEPLKEKRGVGRPRKPMAQVGGLPRQKPSASSTKLVKAPIESKQSSSEVHGPRRSTRNATRQQDAGVVVASSSRNANGQMHSTQSPRKSKPSSSASRRQSALDNLRSRASRSEEDFQPESDGEEADEENENEDEREESGLFVQAQMSPERPLAPSRIDFVRADEMGLGDEDDETMQSSSPPNNRKRKAGFEGARANTGAKRAQFAVEEEPDEQRPDVDRRRLYGQWQSLSAVVKAVNLIGRNTTGKERVPGDRQDIPLDDPDVRATIKLCNKAIRCYHALRTHTGAVEPDQDPVGVLIDISHRVDGLRGQNDDPPTNIEDGTKTTNIYSHLIPKLLKLVEASIFCYEAMDMGDSTDGQLSIGHLKIVKNLAKLVLDLENAAKRYKPRPAPNLHIVQPVREKIVPPLRLVHMALARQIYLHEIGQEDAKRLESQRQNRLFREEQEAQRRQQEAEAQQLRLKWQKLHTERMLAEGGMMRAAKRVHLQIPDFYHTELDQNGIPFEREEVFHPRVGPPPDLVDAAEKRQWSMVELSALSDGLRDYAGPNVFERTFRKYCGQGKELNKYSVTEIVVTAAQLKPMLMRDQRAKYGDVAEWVMAIPVWTRAGHAVGQENEDRVVALSGAETGDVEMAEAIAA